MRSVLVVCLAVACGCGDKTAVPTARQEGPAAAAASFSPRISRAPRDRVVAIGDLHGDLGAARRALKLAGAIDAHDEWIGGTLVVVQTGDEIDRGDDDRLILDLIERLKGQAKSAGGELIALDGNHELMNASLDFRYVTEGGFAAFSEIVPKDDASKDALAKLPAAQRGRAAAFAPGGSYGVMLADRPLFVKIGDDVFVHGGIAKKHVDYGLDKMNDETRDWLLGKSPRPPEIVVSEDGPVWLRWYSQAPSSTECAALGDALAAMGAKRMIMGHTVQRDGITAACDGKAWRIDVGLSSYYHGAIQVLELAGDKITVLKE